MTLAMCNELFPTRFWILLVIINNITFAICKEHFPTIFCLLLRNCEIYITWVGQRKVLALNSFIVNTYQKHSMPLALIHTLYNPCYIDIDLYMYVCMHVFIYLSRHSIYIHNNSTNTDKRSLPKMVMLLRLHLLFTLALLCLTNVINFYP